MQEACQKTNGTMAAILGLENKIVEDVCNEIDGNVKPANYNCPGQLVISGEYNAVERACQILKERGAKRALILPVSGAFHSDLMEPAKKELKDGIDKTEFKKPICRIYQNVSAKPVTDPEIIKMNLLSQLTGAILWSQSVNEMVNDGINEFVEVGPGNTLLGLIRKINPEVLVSKI
jgi:[acyl-carrier-protein] S-malonyltransferase